MKKMKTNNAEGDQPELPGDIISDIYSRLPFKSLMRFRCVSRSHNSIISDPSFVTLRRSRSISKFFLRIALGVFGDNYNTYIIDHESGQIIRPVEKLDVYRSYPEFGYAQGLFCLSPNSKERHVVVYNPCTREVRFLPRLNIVADHEFSNWFWDYYFLGFDPDKKQHKILMTQVYFRHNLTRYWVLTLGTDDSWREIKSPLTYFAPLREEGVHIDGMVYFFTSNLLEGFNLLGFNVKTEEFTIISMWDEFYQTSRKDIKTCFKPVKFEGKLATVILELDRVHLWILQKSHDPETKHIWVKWLACEDFPPLNQQALLRKVDSFFDEYHSCCITPDKEIAIIDSRVKPNRILFYDLKRNSWTRAVEISGLAEKATVVGIYCST